MEEIIELNFPLKKTVTFEWKSNAGGRGMNLNSRFLQEAQELEARWKKTGLLDGIKDRWSRQATAVLLESQRLMNEQNEESI